jgi:5-hydroxyisourate hydrolase
VCGLKTREVPTKFAAKSVDFVSLANTAKKGKTMFRNILVASIAAISLAGAVQANDISTHVLNITTGTGGAGIPVTLEMKTDGDWTEVGAGTTGDNGRVSGFGIDTEQATYRLSFDFSDYDAVGETPFFPEIDIIFTVQDTNREHHVPVLVSPFGYSTYLGN